jgi:hypothetical protein
MDSFSTGLMHLQKFFCCERYQFGAGERGAGQRLGECCNALMNELCGLT